MKKICVSVVTTGLLLASAIYPTASYAASENECAIWLCLPGGFPEGCEGARSAFERRIKKGKSPLPSFSSCAVGGSEGGYEMGHEPFESCKTDFDGRDTYFAEGAMQQNVCVASDCGFSMGKQEPTCDYYVRERRPEPNYIKMWVDGEFIGQYWWKG